MNTKIYFWNVIQVKLFYLFQSHIQKTMVHWVELPPIDKYMLTKTTMIKTAPTIYKTNLFRIPRIHMLFKILEDIPISALVSLSRFLVFCMVSLWWWRSWSTCAPICSVSRASRYPCVSLLPVLSNLSVFSSSLCRWSSWIETSSKSSFMSIAIVCLDSFLAVSYSFWRRFSSAWKQLYLLLYFCFCSEVRSWISSPICSSWGEKFNNLL